MNKEQQNVLKTLLNEMDELNFMYSFLNDNDKNFTIKGCKSWYSYFLGEKRACYRTIKIKEGLLKKIIKTLIDKKQNEINDLLEIN